jgi:hypothetical protein
VELAY